MASAATGGGTGAAGPLRAATPTQFSYQQTMFRVKDPRVSVPFYEKHFGLSLIDSKTFSDFSLYFMATLGAEEQAAMPPPGTADANAALWNFPRTVLELTHNHGTEGQPEFKHHNGNSEPRGFGHIGFVVDDVHGFCERLFNEGVAFQKRPHEGRMKNIAFALDPDGYWVEILPRTPSAVTATLPSQPSLWPNLPPGKPSFQQTMYRVKDGRASVHFYTAHFGMTLACERHFPEAAFSLYFLAILPSGTTLPADPTSEASWQWMCASSGSFLELTHNHGTEAQGSFSYHNGNTEPRGFGHIGYLTPHLEETCAALEAAGVAFTKRPHEGRMRGLAFCKDPDGYLVEIIQKGLVI